MSNRLRWLRVALTRRIEWQSLNNRQRTAARATTLRVQPEKVHSTLVLYRQHPTSTNVVCSSLTRRIRTTGNDLAKAGLDAANQHAKSPTIDSALFAYHIWGIRPFSERFHYGCCARSAVGGFVYGLLQSSKQSPLIRVQTRLYIRPCCGDAISRPSMYTHSGSSKGRWAQRPRSSAGLAGADILI